MIAGKKVLALIVARKGSKGLPGKNVKLLGGYPLIRHTAFHAEQSKYIDHIAVSTDDRAIWEAAGAGEFIERPAELATDRARIMDVVMHALERFTSYTWLVLLQPTSPLRRPVDIDNCIILAQTAKGTISVCKARNHPFWTYFKNKDRLVGMPAPTNRQELPEAFTPNGCVYVSDVEWLRKERSFLTAETVPYIMPPERSVDIDTEADWRLAEYYLERSLDWDG